MNQLNLIYKPVLKGFIATLIAVFIIIAIQRLEHKAMPVLYETKQQNNVTSDNLVALLQEHVTTGYLYKIELMHNKIVVQLKFKNMNELVEQLNNVIDEYTYLFFYVVKNIDDIVIYVSEQTSNQRLYEIKINNEDFKSGKDMKIVPLSL